MNLKGKCVITRMLGLSHRLHLKQSITAHYIMSQYGVSKATAHRDLFRLEQCLPVFIVRTDEGRSLSLGVLDELSR